MSAGEGEKPAAVEPDVECPFCGGTGRARSVDGNCNACYTTPGRITAKRIAEHREHLRGLEALQAKRAKGRRGGRGRW